MDKKPKSSTDNQWASLPEEPLKGSCCCGKKNKAATDNQWTTTAKNSPKEQ